ncbi:MAG: squalene/phytoene synthase family protein [Octadecabacter sp.]|nr:squalene/phytoene synthase family protein [Octadecabacter sp.]
MNPQAVMSHHARSFAPATRFLHRRDRLRVARLYALCRTVDDIADEIGGFIGQAQLKALLDDLDKSHPQDLIAIEAQDLFKGQPVGLAAFCELVYTVAADTDETCITDSAALNIYCMGVAGTVGVMICALFDIDEAYRENATDLGRAMQLTNICRDVAEDALIGRRYLPFTLCPHTPEKIAAGDPAAIKAAEAAMTCLLTEADELYQSAQFAFKALPLRLRLAVASAAAMYKGIGTQLLERNLKPLAGRAFVPRKRKMSLAAGAVLAELFRKRKSEDKLRHARA